MTRTITFFLIALISLCFANENPPKCRNYQQACAAELVKYPELVTEQQTIDSTTTEHGITTSTMIVCLILGRKIMYILSG